MLDLKKIGCNTLVYEIEIPAWAKAEQLEKAYAMSEIWDMKEAVVTYKQKKRVRKNVAEWLRLVADHLYKEEYEKEMGYAKA